LHIGAAIGPVFILLSGTMTIGLAIRIIQTYSTVSLIAMNNFTTSDIISRLIIILTLVFFGTYLVCYSRRKNRAKESEALLLFDIINRESQGEIDQNMRSE
jgi:hypothetical protein